MINVNGKLVTEAFYNEQLVKVEKKDRRGG